MKKRKRSIFEMIWISGAPWFFVAVFVGIKVSEEIATQHREVFQIHSFEDIKQILLVAMIFWIYVVLMNTFWLESDKKIGPFTWLDKYDGEPPDITVRKRKAMYPNASKEFLSSEPDGLVLGYQNGKYVRVKLKKGKILNSMIIGGPGCGKSVLLLSMLIYQLNHKPTQKEKDEGWESMTFFCLDIKPELAWKGTKLKGNKKVKMMNPQDRTSYGWDVFYNLQSDSSDDEIMSALDLICRALIDAGKGGERNEFFYESARNIAKAIFFYSYKQGRSFIQAIDYLTTGSLEGIISQTLQKIEGKIEFKRVYKLLMPYADKEGEAFEGISLAFSQSLPAFEKDDVKYFFDGNPKKASPIDLEECISVFFSLPETLLDEYSILLRLVTMQVVHHCSGRSEQSHMLTLVIDEAARLGKINWIDFLSTSRSRQVATILAFQSLSQMESVWSKEDAKSLIELCRVIAVLSCKDPNSCETFSKWAGEFKEEKKSFNRGGKNEGGYSLSYEDKQILQMSDVIRLEKLGEIVLFLKGEYCRTDVTGARYFNIEELNKISNECVAYNKESEVKNNENTGTETDAGISSSLGAEVESGLPDPSDRDSAGSSENELQETRDNSQSE